ncbi:histone deacetylase [Lentzea tibetensis]|uniref:Histone deacetylase n=1 Tax=Lentzea tibetensis TaxID=2591470 RepID=A0A563EK82_9PSEU|nr:histone deacetylase [Lentzea tibetensis]TWP46500.1 histone deacetylase [Lentzea tibetensis]
MTDLVWYVSYGSNMHADRFACYLEGGVPEGGNRRYPGCRDPTPPRAARGCSAPGGVYFATTSPVWGGGRAFYDPGLPGVMHGRAYLVTAAQFSDVCAQEMYREPGVDLDLGEVLETGRARLGEGRYETLVRLGDDSCPMLTFTAPWSFGDEPLVAPSLPYLRMLGRGLMAAHGWSAREAADHLAWLPGAAGAWTADELAEVL